MILRRFTEHVRQQNWFAVGLDLLVVVVGIYIGLQADAWMSGQRDREVEQEYLQRLLADMESSVENQLVALEGFDESINAIDYLAEALRARTIAEADELQIIVGLNALGWVVRPVTNMVTVRELQSTGNILLIRDIAIREAIGRLESSYASADFGSSQNLSVISQSMPEVMTWAFLGPSEPLGQYRSNSLNDESEYVLVPDHNRMLAHPDAANIASWISGWSKFHGTLLAQHHDDTVAFRDLLRQRIPTQSNSSAP
jgi:hypothetical protein